MVGSDIKNFNPTTNGIDFVTVQSSQTLEPGIFNLGLFTNYAVNSLPIANDEVQGRLKFSDTLLMSDMNIGVGLMNGWDFGFSYPRLIRQSIDTESEAGPRGQFASTGNTELRFNTKFRLWKGNDEGIAVVFTYGSNQIRNNPYVGTGGGPAITSELVYDFAAIGAKFGLNLGYRSRNPGGELESAAIKPTADQIIGSVAASYLVDAIDTKIIGEIYGSQPASTGSTPSFARQASSAEVIAGAKYTLTHNVALHAGAGTELMEGVASPDWRVYAGINWTVGPVFESDGNVVIVESEPIYPEPPLQELTHDIGPVRRGETVIRSYSIKFEFDSTNVTADSAPALGMMAAYLKKPPPVKSLIIEGHTDSVGSEVYNMDLSVRRAQAIKDILVKTHGIDEKIISVKGYGETKPIADNGNYQGRQKNRRVDFVVNR